MAAKPIPDRLNTINVYLIVSNAVEAIAFYVKAFGAEEVTRLPGPDGRSTMHAELSLGNSTLMLSDENPQWNARSAQTLGGSPAALHLCVEDVDAVFQRAVDAGCEVESPVSDMFWGDRYGRLKDPFGFSWGVATRKEDLTNEQIRQRAQEFFSQMSGPDG